MIVKIYERHLVTYQVSTIDPLHALEKARTGTGKVISSERKDSLDAYHTQVNDSGEESTWHYGLDRRTQELRWMYVG